MHANRLPSSKVQAIYGNMYCTPGMFVWVK